MERYHHGFAAWTKYVTCGTQWGILIVVIVIIDSKSTWCPVPSRYFYQTIVHLNAIHLISVWMVQGRGSGVYKHINVWYDITWYDIIWYNAIWCKMIYDVIWYDVWCMIYCMIWCDVMWCMICYDVIWYDMIWYNRDILWMWMDALYSNDMMWCDVMYDMLWCCMMLTTTKTANVLITYLWGV